ncbi:sulfotransferase family protein, partial [Planktothrix sp.]|uniref:sulfotransferase family protein n=1 Tax=Planktothrix sp. TaxID=3088171 RepID=UPI0038D47327
NEQLTEAVAKIYETDLYDYPSVEDMEEQQQVETQEERKMGKVNHPISKKSNKVFGIGLSKTGTTSLTLAMKVLGYKTKHYLLNCDVDLTIENHDFVSDMPIQTRYKEYDKEYPGSKFILTVRNKESWLKSCSKHFRGYVTDKNSLRYKYRIEQTGIDRYDEEVFSKKYDQHIENAKEYFKNREADLLIIDICAGDGWDKLCEFLGKDVP